jgi:hypothetical protein
MTDEITNEHPCGLAQGVTARLFDSQSQQWTIHFAANVHGSLLGVEQGAFTPPLIGRFVQGRGVFLGHERIGAQHVYTRYVWSDITPTTYHWEQAFSADGGEQLGDQLDPGSHPPAAGTPTVPRASQRRSCCSAASARQRVFA